MRSILKTSDFSAWEASTNAVLGFHRSRLNSPASSFRAHYSFGTAGPLDVLHVQGCGELELDREQCGPAVLWIPLRGTSQERVNGQLFDVGPGTALLIRPGDQLLGRTAADLECVSLLMRDTATPGLSTERSSGLAPVVATGPGPEDLASTALELVLAIRRQDPCRAVVAQQLVDHVEGLNPPRWRTSLGQRRRWQLVVEASRWMEARLDQPFGISEPAGALACSKRTLQHAFACELGRSPLAQARLLRLRRLRLLLQQRQSVGQSIAALMGSCGLLACGATARAYADCYGETPKVTRARAATAR
ncbi:MAG: helix-turn-helix domain-containing protein [Cyanobacteriota bacterium]